MDTKYLDTRGAAEDIKAHKHKPSDSAAEYAPERAWKPAHREEIISALWFIVAFVALDAGCPRWLFIGFFVKACSDMVCCVQCSLREWWREDSYTDKDSNRGSKI
jgi:hypothetical protein